MVRGNTAAGIDYWRPGRIVRLCRRLSLVTGRKQWCKQLAASPRGAGVNLFVWVFFCRYAIRSGSAEWLVFSARRQQPVLEQFLLPAVEDRRLESHFIAQLRDGLVLHHVPPQDGRPSLPARIAFVASSCVVSISLNGATRSLFPTEPERYEHTNQGKVIPYS